MKRDQKLIHKILGDLGVELKIKPKILEAVTEITLSAYNPQMYGIKVADGNVINNIKKMFKIVFPLISVEIVDELAQLIFEKDPRSLQYIFSKKGKPKDTDA